MKKTVFFDLGNVLLFFSHQKMCSQIGQAFGTPAKIIHELLFKRGIADAYEIGTICSEEVHLHLSKTLKKEAPLLSFLQAASDIFEPNTAILPVVQKLKNSGVRLILLSNTCEAHFNFAFSHYPVLKYFDDFLLSYELKIKKPDPRIFAKALSLSAPDASFYTDDLKENILSARKAGLDSERFTETNKLELHLKSRGFIS